MAGYSVFARGGLSRLFSCSAYIAPPWGDSQIVPHSSIRCSMQCFIQYFSVSSSSQVLLCRCESPKLSLPHVRCLPHVRQRAKENQFPPPWKAYSVWGKKRRNSTPTSVEGLSNAQCKEKLTPTRPSAPNLLL